MAVAPQMLVDFMKTDIVDIVLFVVTVAFTMAMRSRVDWRHSAEVFNAKTAWLEAEPVEPTALLSGEQAIARAAPTRPPTAVGRGDLAQTVFTLVGDVVPVPHKLGRTALQHYLDARWERIAGPPELYAKLIQCAVGAGRAKLVSLIFDDMVRDEVPRSLELYEGAMKQLASQKEPKLALDLYDGFLADGFEPTHDTLSCLMRFAYQVGELDRALGFFADLSAMTTPSVRAYMTILQVHVQRKDWNKVLVTFREMESTFASLDTPALNVTLAAGVSAGKIDEVAALFNEIVARKPALPNVISYNTVLKGYAQSGNITQAMALLDKMDHKVWPHVAPDKVTYNTVMTAAVRSSTPLKAWDVLGIAQASTFKPNDITCTLLIRGIPKTSCSCEHISRCACLLRRYGKTCDVKLRGVLHNTLLEMAYAQRHNDVTLCVEVFEEMQRQGLEMQPNMKRLVFSALRNVGSLSDGPMDSIR